MIPHGVEIFVGVEPIDLRWGFDRLSGIVTERMARPPRSGALFVFFGKRRDAMKILFADGSGRIIAYTIDQTTMMALWAYNDGNPLPPNALGQ